MSGQKPVIRSEDTAGLRRMDVWVCRVCQRQWGSDERMARFCCANDFPCECGERRGKHYSHCRACRHRRAAESWFAKEPVAWNGEFPLALEDSYETFFWSEDDLLDYLVSNCQPLGELWLTSCEPTPVPHFNLVDFLCDALPEDGDVGQYSGAVELETAVNKWIKESGPFSFTATGKRLDIDSVRSQLNISPEAEGVCRE